MYAWGYNNRIWCNLWLIVVGIEDGYSVSRPPDIIEGVLRKSQMRKNLSFTN